MVLVGLIVWAIGNLWLLVAAYKVSPIWLVPLLLPNALLIWTLANPDAGSLMIVAVINAVCGLALLFLIIYNFGKTWFPVFLSIIGAVAYYQGGGPVALQHRIAEMRGEVDEAEADEDYYEDDEDDADEEDPEENDFIPDED